MTGRDRTPLYGRDEAEAAGLREVARQAAAEARFALLLAPRGRYLLLDPLDAGPVHVTVRLAAPALGAVLRSAQDDNLLHGVSRAGTVPFFAAVCEKGDCPSPPAARRLPAPAGGHPPLRTCLAAAATPHGRLPRAARLPVLCGGRWRTSRQWHPAMAAAKHVRRSRGGLKSARAGIAAALRVWKVGVRHYRSTGS